MTCPNCGSPTLSFPVPESVRGHLPDDRASATICTHCLQVAPSDDAVSEYPDFSRASTAFPDDGETAAVLASLLALLDRLVLHREDADAVAEVAERRGVDVLLFLDRVAADDSADPELDVTRRRTQLEQLI
ncbi:DUF6276 family protein [Halobacterium rubrum]|uniref:DUF6276 family protein n=1 Tax=Halobacterium TaxID=2239 RepID=UPI001F2C7835|nr:MULTISPECIES: DUF6276 family protein [Halobacterium]MDH5019093.1 DUF6276 family protein [Halobacterium rubrum]